MLLLTKSKCRDTVSLNVVSLLAGQVSPVSTVSITSTTVQATIAKMAACAWTV